MTAAELPDGVSDAGTKACAECGVQAERTAWDTVVLSRKANRPTALDYINAVFDEFN